MFVATVLASFLSWDLSLTAGSCSRWHVFSDKRILWCLVVAVLRLLLNLARAVVFVQEGLFGLSRSWPLDVGMVLGGWAGLICGNACAHFFRDANSLHWW